MADFAPNYTSRFRIKYSTQGRNHSLTWRVSSDEVSPAAVTTKMGAFLAAIQGFLYTDWTIISADWALADSDIFLPTALPANPVGASNVAVEPQSSDAMAVSWVGRSTLGGRARFFIYGMDTAGLLATATGDDWRITSVESPDIASGVTVLDNETPSLVANDDAVVNWYPYVNLKYNDRWVRKMRQG